MATVAKPRARKSKVESPKPQANGRAGPTFNPPQFVSRACEGCGRLLEGWAMPDNPLRCPDCEPPEDNPLAEKTCESCGKQFFTQSDREICVRCLDRADGHGGTNSAATEMSAAAAESNVKATRKAKPPKGERQPTGGELATREMVDIRVAIAKIEIRQQKRKEFDQAKVEALAESIKAQGLLQPPIVRHNPGNAAQPYLLVAGERRIRAVKLLKWASVPLKLLSGEVDDVDAGVIQGEENILRQDFNDVELAKYCQWATSPREAGGAGMTQEQLAKRIGVTQAEISNRIRLLRAPPWALDLVISQQMSRKHALELVAWEGRDAILDAIEKETKARISGRSGLGTAENYRDAVRDIVRSKGAALARNVSVNSPYKSTELRIDPKHPQYAELDVIELPRRWGGVEKIALNATLANKILGEKAKTWKAKHQVAGDTKGAKGKKLSPAEAKAKAEADREARRGKLQEFLFDWRCWLCAEAIYDDPDACWLAITAAALNIGELFEDPFAAAEDACSELWPKKKPVDAAMLLARNAADVETLVAKFARGLFWSEREKNAAPSPWRVSDAEQEIVAWCERLGVDLAEAWTAKATSGKGQAFAGPLTDRYFELLDRDRLGELADEWGVNHLPSESRDFLSKKLREYETRVFPLPAELAELIGGKKKRGGKKR